MERGETTLLLFFARFFIPRPSFVPRPPPPPPPPLSVLHVHVRYTWRWRDFPASRGQTIFIQQMEKHWLIHMVDAPSIWLQIVQVSLTTNQVVKNGSPVTKPRRLHPCPRSSSLSLSPSPLFDLYPLSLRRVEHSEKQSKGIRLPPRLVRLVEMAIRVA